ncbi:MAG: hypothetical protein WCF67_05215 [Chitinophagaceae bacterium]
MRTMPTKLHAVLDYFIALLSILSPLIFGFGEGGNETLLPISFGLLIILYSFFSDYEFGFTRQIPMWAHLRIDQMAGLLMAASPWIFRFYGSVYLPHVLLGLSLIISSLATGNDVTQVIQFVKRPWGRIFGTVSNQ